MDEDNRLSNMMYLILVVVIACLVGYLCFVMNIRSVARRSYNDCIILSVARDLDSLKCAGIVQ